MGGMSKDKEIPLCIYWPGATSLKQNLCVHTLIIRSNIQGVSKLHNG